MKYLKFEIMVLEENKIRDRFGDMNLMYLVRERESERA